jgi:glycosyltransferase involved in cell wall biosynthesis
MGALGRALVASRFDWDRIAARHIEVYRGMAQSNQRAERYTDARRE